MFFQPDVGMWIYLSVMAMLTGMVIGGVSGCLVSLALRLGWRGALWDAPLGAVGLVGGFVGSVLIPWPRNTITYKVGDTVVSSTMNSYQHPDIVALVLAILLPVLREVYRLRRSRSNLRNICSSNSR
jgi:hypothetical protein